MREATSKETATLMADGWTPDGDYWLHPALAPVLSVSVETALRRRLHAKESDVARAETKRSASLDAAVMARLRAPFGCEYIGTTNVGPGYWRIHDANDDAVASVSRLEEGYARLIVQALNEHFERRR